MIPDPKSTDCLVDRRWKRMCIFMCFPIWFPLLLVLVILYAVIFFTFWHMLGVPAYWAWTGKRLNPVLDDWFAE